MSRRCQCHRKCPHVLRGSEALLPPERLAALAHVIGTLIDAASGFDAAGLQLDPACGIHGTKAVSNDECICEGRRYTATEFVQTLEIEIRAAGRYEYPAGQPNRLREGMLRLVATG